MKKRLLIGVIVCEAEQLMQRRLIKGMMAQAFSMDIDIAVFSCITDLPELTSHQKAEFNIFEYMHYPSLDGILYLRDSIRSDEERQKLDALLTEQKIPVLVLDSNSGPFPYLMMDDRSGFCEITEHLICEHGLTDLICLTGPKGHYTSEERLRGFRDAMTAAGIPVKDEDLIYGDYWYGSAKKLAQELVSGERRMPQGIVCGNDSMAKALCHELICSGIRIPEDVSVTGYDASLSETHSMIPLTSFVRRNFRLGAQGVARLYQMMTGESCRMVQTEQIGVLTGESCSCGVNPAYLKKQIRMADRLEDFQAMYSTSNLSMRMTS
ncbi:MAG: substrate-binding domain-containing protein, partial [Oscillospiraceae bacterium]|nr:substrate-binding domain-containing protein [Oscillospiraceae bacterium]